MTTKTIRLPLSETGLAAEAIKALRSIGALCERIHAGQAMGLHGGRMQLAGDGTPDWLVVFRGRVTLLEFKRPGQEPSPEQVDWHERAARRGVTVHIVSSVEQALRAVS